MQGEAEQGGSPSGQMPSSGAGIQPSTETPRFRGWCFLTSGRMLWGPHVNIPQNCTEGLLCAKPPTRCWGTVVQPENITDILAWGLLGQQQGPSRGRWQEGEPGTTGIR